MKFFCGSLLYWFDAHMDRIILKLSSGGVAANNSSYVYVLNYVPTSLILYYGLWLYPFI